MDTLDLRTISGTDAGLLDDTPASATPMIVAQIQKLLDGGFGVDCLSLLASLFEQTRGTVWEMYSVKLAENVDFDVMTQIDTEIAAVKQAIEDGTGHQNYIDIYRRYVPHLRAIINAKRETAPLAKQLLADLFSEQTLPGNEVDQEYFVDSYTGERLPDEDDEASWKNIAENDYDSRPAGIPPMHEDPLVSRSKEVVQDLGWTEETRQAFLQTQRSQLGVQDEGEEALHQEDRGFVPEMLTHDFEFDMSKLVEAFAFINAFNAARRALFAKMRRREIQPNCWYQVFRKNFVRTGVFVDMVAQMELLKREHPMYAALVFIKVEG